MLSPLVDQSPVMQPIPNNKKLSYDKKAVRKGSFFFAPFPTYLSLERKA